MTEALRPKRIYLQVEDHYGDRLDFEDGVTWCWERINESDLVYVSDSELARALAPMPCGHPGACEEAISNSCGWCAAEAERDALREKLKAAKGLAEALESHARVPDTRSRDEYWGAVSERYYKLVIVQGRQALAAWKALETGK